MAYVLRFPFRLNDQLNDADEPVEFVVGEHTVTLKARPPFVITTIRPFQSEGEARAFAQVAWAAVRWMLLERGVNSTVSRHIQELTRTSDPAAAAVNIAKSFGLLAADALLHALGDEGEPSVYQEDETVRYIAMGTPTVTVGTSLSNVANALVAPLGWEAAAALAADERFVLASDLFSAFFHEYSAGARLVTLGMVLEVIADAGDKHESVLALMDRWLAELRAERAASVTDSELDAAYESLEKEMCHKKEASKRSRIRRTALRLGASLGKPQAAKLAKDAVRVYDRRSDLVHKGHLPEPELSTTVESGRLVVQELLRLYYLAVRGDV